MSLYKIDREIMECLDPETGEIVDFERLEELHLEKEQKIESVAMYIKNLAAEAAGIKLEEDALAARRKVKENKVKRLKEYLTDILGGQKFETAKVALSFRSSTGTEITDASALLDWLERNNKENCIKYKAPEIAVGEVGKLLKAGEDVPGAALVSRSNIQIK